MLRLRIGDDISDADITNQRARRRLLLNRLKRDMTLYFGFVSKQEIAEAFALREVLGRRETDPNRIAPGDPGTAGSVNTATREVSLTADENREKTALKDIFEQIVDSDEEGKRYLDSSLPSDASEAAKSQTLKGGIQNALQGVPQNDPRLRNYAKCIRLHYTKAVNNPNNPAITSGENQLFFDDLDKALPYKETNSPFINEVRKRICAVRMEHPLFAPGDSTSDLLTMFFNAMPPLEMTRAIPVLNVTIYSAKPSITEFGRLSGLTLQKSLEGAIAAPNSDNPSLMALNKASVLSSSINGERVLTGLELFRGSQTMQNIEASKQNENHLAPVIDPMRPLASIKGFAIDMQSSYGLNGTRTATLEMVLHDRSRFGEFANFIKPDRFGTAYVEVEYGWSHPDELGTNPFADLLNLSRVIDHFNITTTNFSFDEVGQVMITLNMHGRGSSETSELSIVGPESSARIQTQINQIEQLAKTVKQLSERIPAFSQQNTTSGTHRQEVRGIQGLNAAQDAVNNLVLTRELQEQLRELQRSLAIMASSNQVANTRDTRGRRSASTSTINSNTQQVANSARQLQNVISQIYPDISGRGQRGNQQNVAGPRQQFTNTINEEINDLLTKINSISDGNSPPVWNRENRYNDIFLNSMDDTVWSKLTSRAQSNVLAIDSNHTDAVRPPDDTLDLTNLGLTQGRPNPPAGRRR
jgi:hypothetical protein